MSTIFCDRDGVVNVRRHCPEDHYKHYVLKWEDFEWIPGAKEALARLIDNGHYIVFVSNQAGIGEGLTKKGEIDWIFHQMIDEIWYESEKRPLKCMAYIFCPHTEKFGCECRKPSPGMFYKMMFDLELSAQKCWMIGDQRSDMKAAWNASIRRLIKLPSLEDPEAPVYNYDDTVFNFNINTAEGVLIDSLPNAVAFILEWEEGFDAKKK